MYGAKWRHQYDLKADEAIGRASTTRFLDKFGVPEESLTQQSFAKDADINTIVRVFARSPDLPLPAAPDASYYFDTRGAPDLRTALETTREAVDRFNALPAELRARFQNQPARLWDFVRRSENHEEAVKLGLLCKSVPPPPPTPEPLRAAPAAV